jgi:hypothetical protein
LLKKTFGFGIAIVMPFVMSSAFLTSRPAPESAPVIESPLPIHTAGPLSPQNDDDDVGGVDVLGNPVSDAVARYKFDAAGSLYELHSPQTELPRLGAPKS